MSKNPIVSLTNYEFLSCMLALSIYLIPKRCMKCVASSKNVEN